MSTTGNKYALLSVTDKTGIVDFAEVLVDNNYRIVSTGGTGHVLEEGGIEVIQVSDWTGVSEMLGGRVKTLHPHIHAAILARRDRKEHMEELSTRGIEPIDLVAVNLYDFRTATNEGKTGKDLMEEVDIGGPTMLRAAAKNYHAVVVVSNPAQYDDIKGDLSSSNGEITMERRKELAEDAFSRCASYDQYIAASFQEHEQSVLNNSVQFNMERVKKLRYGENPHQEGALYRNSRRSSGGFPDGATSIHGKELSYNNLMDLDAAYRVLAEIGKGKTACTVIKHMTPCGAATADTAVEAFKQAHSGDPTSAFGSIVGFNVPVTEKLAREIATDNYYVEAIIAPEIEEGVVRAFEEGPNWGDRIRLVPTGEMKLNRDAGNPVETRTLSGGYLLQQRDEEGWPEDVDVVSGTLDGQAERDMKFAWLVCKHVRSNAIVLAKDTAVVGTGAGQPSRVDAAEIAVDKAGERAEGAVMASDAFFPFPDALEVGLDAGVKAAVQPGGSVNDEAVIDVARERGIIMVLTGQRHFKH